VLERNFQIDRGFGIMASRNRLRRSLKPINMEMNMETITWLHSIRPRITNEKFPRVTMRGKPHN
jgi:hypothetical protein